MKSTKSSSSLKRSEFLGTKDPETLLEMALAQEKKNWLPGEKILLWGSKNPKNRAYLIEKGGTVDLVLAPYPDLTCVIFQQDPLTSFWDIAEELNDKYENWKHRIKLIIESSRPASIGGNVQYLRDPDINNQVFNRKYNLRRRENYGIQIGYKTT